ncbi:rhamnogalacturonan acetylesterase [uncultured Bacteroides sp.]|uniref:rhamnogalacturonan acetylesterase n=1 Tax=uncultured Bacteroides sp. TaxID=162156 RepID=UPI0025F11BAB|nr:rhamnogalacturonan acetylesterase [uncultured Bacteroides sp.]
MKTTLMSLLLLASVSIEAQNLPQTFKLSDVPRYSEKTGYGYDRVDTPKKDSNAPFYFSVRVPDGNYRVTVRLGSKKQAGNTTVRAESRRLFVENLPTKKGEFIEETFIVNKRSPRISAKESVKIKEREKSKLDWDDRLTIEINGDAPVCESIRVEAADASAPTIFLCGNSTVVDQENEPWASWGQMIPRFFNSGIAIANYAESGESANTFIAAKRLKKALSIMKKGDYLLVEFGHNDQKQKGPGKGAYYSFMTNLKIFIDEVRAKGGQPVLVTPTRRRKFDKEGHTVNTHGEYPDAVRWIAAKENVPLIELNNMTGTLYEALGEKESKKAFVHYPMGSFPGQKKKLEDNTHFNPYGAYQIAKCVIEGMKKATPELVKYLKTDISYDPAKPDDIASFHWCPAPFCEMEKPDGN